jgi:hypothetical protein
MHNSRGGKLNPSNLQFPLKFLPNDYYIKQLKNIAKILPNEHLFVYIFTDADDPQALATNFKKSITIPISRFIVNQGKELLQRLFSKIFI